MGMKLWELTLWHVEIMRVDLLRVTIGVIIHKLPPRDIAKVRKKHMLLW